MCIKGQYKDGQGYTISIITIGNGSVDEEWLRSGVSYHILRGMD